MVFGIVSAVIEELSLNSSVSMLITPSGMTTAPWQPAALIAEFAEIVMFPATEQETVPLLPS
jgi:hypothetical protein